MLVKPQDENKRSRVWELNPADGLLTLSRKHLSQEEGKV